MTPTGKAQNYGLGIAFLLGGVFCFATMEATAKYLADSFSVIQITWGRYLFNLLCLSVLFLNRPAAEVLRTRRLKLQLARAVFILGVTVCFFAGISLMRLADATAVLYAAPLFVTALSVPLLGEKVGWHRWASVAVGFGGVLLVARPGSGIADWPALIVLAGAVCYGFYTNITRMLGPTESPWTTVFYTALVGAVAMSLAVPFEWTEPGLVDWLLFAELGILGGLGHYLIFKAYETAEPSALSPFTYSHLVWAALLGLIFFGEFPDGWTIAGAAVIAGSGLYIWHRERQGAR